MNDSECRSAAARTPPDGLADLFAEHRDRLQRMVRLRLSPAVAGRVDASDVLQEAYLDADKQYARFLRERPASPYVWLRGITWQRLIKMHRQHLGTQQRAVSREASLPTDSSVNLATRLMSKASTPSRSMLKVELRRRVQLALSRLKHEDREVIVLRDFEGLTNGEAAQVMGLTDSGATMRYGRALVRLRKVLEVEFEGEEPQA